MVLRWVCLGPMLFSLAFWSCKQRSNSKNADQSTGASKERSHFLVLASAFSTCNDAQKKIFSEGFKAEGIEVGPDDCYTYLEIDPSGEQLLSRTGSEVKPYKSGLYEVMVLNNADYTEPKDQGTDSAALFESSTSDKDFNNALKDLGQSETQLVKPSSSLKDMINDPANKNSESKGKVIGCIKKSSLARTIKEKAASVYCFMASEEVNSSNFIALCSGGATLSLPAETYLDRCSRETAAGLDPNK